MTWGLLFAWAMAGPKLTPEQAEREERVAEEDATHAAAARRQAEAEYDERDHRQKTARQEKDLRLAQSGS
jgi:hypothetical protein